MRTPRAGRDLLGSPVGLWPVMRYFLHLGTFGFGGPVALVGYMQRDLVERRRWFTTEEYLKGLALSQLAPGPLAAQLPICLGYVQGRVGQVFCFFAKAGAFVFGSGLAIVPFLYGGVVQDFRWLDDRQFLDAVAVAMIKCLDQEVQR